MIQPPVPELPAAGPAPAAAPRPWGFWATIGLTLAVMAATMLACVVAMSILVAVLFALGIEDPKTFGAESASSNGLLMSAIFIVAAPPCVGLTVLFAWLRRRRYALQDYLGLHRPRIASLAAWLGACIALAAASDALTYYLGRPIVPEFMEKAYRTSVFPPLLFLAVVVVAPLAEEFLFRGFLLEGLRRSCVGAAGAILISAGAWSLLHTQYDVYGMGVILVCGILLAAARMVTNSIWVCILMHSLNNLLATVETAVKVHFF